MNNKIILGILVVVILAIGGFMLLNNNAGNTNPTSQTTQTQNTTPTQQEQQMEKAEDVTVTSSGYEPATITVKPGTKVVWTNKSGVDITVNSDLHPTHLLWPFLNLGKFADGATVSVVFEKEGTYTYHNHFNASQTGTVVVK